MPSRNKKTGPKFKAPIFPEEGYDKALCALLMQVGRVEISKKILNLPIGKDDIRVRYDRTRDVYELSLIVNKHNT